MNSSVEDDLYESVGVKSVSELPDFPFASYEDFISSIHKGDVSIGIDYTAARNLSHITKSAASSNALLALSWIPFLFIPASIAVAFATKHWFTLLGILTAPIGMALASPHNPLKRLLSFLGIVSVGYCLISATVLTSSAWLAFSFGLSLLTTNLLNRTAWNWAYRAILGSEALTAYLWKSANLHIMGKEFGMKTGRLGPSHNKLKSGSA